MFKKLVLTTITIVCLVLCPSVQANQSQQHSVSNVKKTIVKNSIELGIDPALALSIAKSESGFKHDRRSTNGAVGVFQLMPSTAKRMGLNPYYVSDNIKGGLMYYKRMYAMFGSTELALAAYNAGPAAVKKYKSVPPYGVTRRYVSNIMAEYHRQKIHPDPAISSSKSHSSQHIKANKEHAITSKHNVSKEKMISKTQGHTIAKENTNLMKKTLAKQQNVRFVLVKSI